MTSVVGPVVSSLIPVPRLVLSSPGTSSSLSASLATSRLVLSRSSSLTLSTFLSFVSAFLLRQGNEVASTLITTRPKSYVEFICRAATHSLRYESAILHVQIPGLSRTRATTEIFYLYLISSRTGALPPPRYTRLIFISVANAVNIYLHRARAQFPPSRCASSRLKLNIIKKREIKVFKNKART